MAELTENKLFMIICAVLLPPVAVGIKTGFSIHLLINIILCILFYLPGMIHALWVVLK